MNIKFLIFICFLAISPIYSAQKYEDKGSLACEQVQKVLKLLERSDSKSIGQNEIDEALRPFAAKVLQVRFIHQNLQHQAVQEAVHRMQVSKLIADFFLVDYLNVYRRVMIRL